MLGWIAVVEIAIISVYFVLPIVPAGVPGNDDFTWSAVNYAPLAVGGLLLVRRRLVVRLGPEVVHRPPPYRRPAGAASGGGRRPGRRAGLSRGSGPAGRRRARTASTTPGYARSGSGSPASVLTQGGSGRVIRFAGAAAGGIDDDPLGR